MNVPGTVERPGRGTEPNRSPSWPRAGVVFRKLGTAARLLRQRPGRFFAYLLGGFERYVLYAAVPTAIPPPTPREGVTLSKLSDEDLEALPTDQVEFRAQRERVRRLGYNDAFGVWCAGRLAHIAWLVPSEHDCRNPVRTVKLGPGEAEITHCATLPEFRGQGLYPFAIRSLCELAATRGLGRVFMVTNHANIASQRGIEKAGLVRVGRITRWSFPYLPERFGVTRRPRRTQIAKILGTQQDPRGPSAISMMKRTVRELRNRLGLRTAPPASLAAAELGADWYDRDYATTDKYRAPYYQSYYYFLWSVIVDRALRGGHRRVLEIGCGAGRLAAYLYDQGIEDYVGLDFSKAAIAIAREHVPHGRFVVGDARDPAIYRATDYDLIICTEVLEHVEDDLGIVGHFREGVRCLCSVPSFPFESHVRCFRDAAAVAERYAPFFEGFSVMTFRSPNAAEDRFFLMDGVRNGHRV